MQRKLNKKGMTLIEIVVVLLISTIIMSVVGTMILSSMGYFSEEVVSQQDKDGLGDISGYIRKELSYATDVRIATTKPTEDDWHWLSIQEGKLYKDNKQLLSDSYYQNRKLTIKIQGFDNYRLDVHLKYLDNTSKEVANTRTSLELMNLKAEANIDREYAPFSTAMDINETQKIYYITKEKVVEEEPEEDNSGTVEDQISCLNNYNNRGTFIDNTIYYTGDFVQDRDGYWWINIGSSRHYEKSEGPDDTKKPTGWKKLTSMFDVCSSYEKGDIILYKINAGLHYFRAEQDMITNVPPPGLEWTKGAWTDLGTEKPEVSAPVCRSLLSGQMVKTVRNKLDGVNLDKIPEYDNKKTYHKNEIVKVTDRFGVVFYYLKVIEVDGKPETNADSGWQKLARDYTEKSAYLKGDVVLYLRDGITSLTFINDMCDQSFNVKSEIQKAYSDDSEYITIKTN